MKSKYTSCISNENLASKLTDAVSIKYTLNVRYHMNNFKNINYMLKWLFFDILGWIRNYRIKLTYLLLLLTCLQENFKLHMQLASSSKGQLH